MSAIYLAMDSEETGTDPIVVWREPATGWIRVRMSYDGVAYDRTPREWAALAVASEATPAPREVPQ